MHAQMARVLKLKEIPPGNSLKYNGVQSNSDLQTHDSQQSKYLFRNCTVFDGFHVDVTNLAAW